MRSEGQVQHKLKQVTYRHLQKLLRKNYRRRPSTCRYNHRVVLGEDVYVDVCSVTRTDGTLCQHIMDERLEESRRRARTCPYWEPRQTKEEIVREFKAFLQDNDRGVIASRYPDIAALMWVLDDGEAQTVFEELDEDDDSLAESPESKNTTGFFRSLFGRGKA